MSRKFVVLSTFKDLKDNNHIYKAGAFYPRSKVKVDDERVDELSSNKNAQNKALIVEVLSEEKPKAKPKKAKEAVKK